MGQVIMSGIVPKLTTPVPPPAGIPLSDLIEGQIVMIPENGVLTPFYLAKHDYESGLNGTGRMLMVRKEAHTQMAWHSVNNTCVYSTSDIDTWFNTTYKAMLEPAVQTAIDTTTFYAVVGGTSNAITTLSRSVFALSVAELGSTGNYLSTDGSLLPTASTLFIAYKDGTAVNQWTRSTYYTGSQWTLLQLAEARSDNGYSSTTASSIITTNYARPCFTLPSTMLVDAEPNADGSVNLIY